MKCSTIVRCSLIVTCVLVLGISALVRPTGPAHAMTLDPQRFLAVGDQSTFNSLVGSTCPGAISLMGANGSYVAAEVGYTGDNYAMSRARSSSLPPYDGMNPPWEDFHPYFTGGYFELGSPATAPPGWVSVELGYTGNNYAMLRARSSNPSTWEEFALYYDRQTGKFALNAAANGLWVSTELGYTGDNYAMLRARSSSVSTWEEFSISATHFCSVPILMIHGFNPGSSINCNSGSEFGDIKEFARKSSFRTMMTIGFYKNDTNCDDYVGRESSHCTNYADSGSDDGTVNEDIRHVSCLIAWYIFDNFTSYGTSVDVIAHSMGGILIRQALFDTGNVSQLPPYLYVNNVVTAGSPHQGLTPFAAKIMSGFKGCPGDCFQVAQMEADSDIMINLNDPNYRKGSGLDPQGYGGTNWTTMSSEYDDEVLAYCVAGWHMGGPIDDTEACGLMPGATHFVVYPGPSNSDPNAIPTYTHGGYLTDPNTNADATEIYSDNSGGNWVRASNRYHSIATMYQSISIPGVILP
jgi:PGAP1-like protein